MRKAMVYVDDNPYWFAEVEPDRWLGVDRQPVVGDEPAIAALRRGDDSDLKPVLLGTEWLSVGEVDVFDTLADEIADD